MTSPVRTTSSLFLPLGGSGEIGMNLNLYGHAGKWIMVDLGITFGDDTTPGVEVDHARPDLHRGAQRDLCRHRADPRPRGPSRRRGRPVAAARGAGLCHAVRRLGAARKLREAGLLDAVPITEIPLGGKFTLGAVRARADHHDPFDPRAERAGDPHPARHGAAYRRLEDRSRAAAGRGHRRGDAAAHRRRGRARHGLRQHQRLRRRRGGLRGDRARQPREAGEDAQRPGRRHLLRLQPGARGEHRPGGRRGRPPSGAVGPGAAAHGRGGAGMRLPARLPATAFRAARRATCRAKRCCSSAPAARASRAPRWPSSPTASIATWCWRRAIRRSSPRGSSPATSARSAACRTR